MIAALARASRVFEQPSWLALAERAFAFVVDTMERDGRLAHAWCSGRISAQGTAADYANMTRAAIRLHEATGRPDYLAAAERWASALDHHHWLPDPGGYATAADDTTDVIVRLCTAADDAVPNANGTMLSNLVALHLLTGRRHYLDRAEAIPRAFGRDMAQNLVGHCGLAAAMHDLANPLLVVIVAPAAGADRTLRRAVDALSLPGALELAVPSDAKFPAGSPLHGKSAIAGTATLYACLGPTCSAPQTAAEGAGDLLRALRRAPTVA
jgi:hypothetical protein